MPHPKDDTLAVHTLYGQLHAQMVSADTAGLSTLLTDDFHLIHMTGYDQPRAQWLADIQSGRMRYFSSTEEEVTVHIDGDTARLRGRNRVSAEIWGARGTWPLQLDAQLVRRRGQWQISVAVASTY